MPPKSPSVFGLAPLEGMFSDAGTTSITRYRSGAELPALERKVIDELSKQRLVIEAQREKTEFAMTQIGDLHEHGSHVFNRTTTYIMEVKQQTRGKEHQSVIDEFTARQISTFGRQMLGAMEVGGTKIGEEVFRPLYPTADPPEPKGFWKRLLG